ncbi:ABC transporter ATP-binding protein [Mucilaginibacter sp. AW1-3]
MKQLAIDINGLMFSYPGHITALFSNFNLKINKGERFGLFGPNGAGKTTLMSLMVGLLTYDTGSIKLIDAEVSGHKLSVNKIFGYVPQDFSFYQELSPAENLEFFGAWYGLNKQQIQLRSQELLTVLGLQDVRDKPVEKFSGGMKRRVNLAIGVMHNPEVLFLDEPTVGVDVQTRFAIIDYLKQLNQQGTTLIYTSHQLSEAESLCTRIAMIDNGKLIVYDELNTLLAQHSQTGLEGLFLNLTGKNYRDS